MNSTTAIRVAFLSYGHVNVYHVKPSLWRSRRRAREGWHGAGSWAKWGEMPIQKVARWGVLSEPGGREEAVLGGNE